MKPDIGKDNVYLCSPQIPFTECLFVDDLQKRLKHTGDQNKIGAKIQSKDCHSNNSNSYGNSYGSKYRNAKKIPESRASGPGEGTKVRPRAQSSDTIQNNDRVSTCTINKNVEAGNMTNFIDNRRLLISDSSIRETYTGYLLTQSLTKQ